MEAASLAISVVQTLFAALQGEELRKICSLWGYESELARLQDTVTTIKCVLLDAECKQVLNHQQLHYVEKLKAAVYDADDLLDEFTALAEQQQYLLDRGMGGLGKTTLAQNIYQHDKVKSAFQLRLWTCISDQDQDQLLLQPILAKVLESATGKKQDGSGIELVQRELRELLQGSKYILFLDDVWTENHNEWLKLENFLIGGGRGSRIVVTTRSEKTAETVGSIVLYRLQGLSEENSWDLFERVAFGGRQGQEDHHELAKIGKKIVKKCSNVPLSIRVVGSLLYGQEKKNWLEFERRALPEIVHGDKTLMPVLKLSYNHLQPAMKSCFSYCALFPKDSVIGKETVISLWMAQGYIEPLREGQRIEDAGEDYFLILLSRCFFQDVEKDDIGEIVSFKMHDLMHDMAQHVAGKEMYVGDFNRSGLNEKVRHVCESSCEIDGDYYFSGTKIRTFMKPKGFIFPIIQAMFTKWTNLRVLEVMSSPTDMRSLPDSIGNLLHLRYINLSGNSFLETLPESVTQLHYLQTLILKWCASLKELPNGLCKLRKLRSLDIEGCRQINCMPPGLDTLRSLCRLTTFVVSNVCREPETRSDGLDELRALNDLRGPLIVTFWSNFRYVKKERRGGYLSNKEYLTRIVIQLDKFPWMRRVVDGDEELLEDLQPHQNLKALLLQGYADARMPRWTIEEKLGTSLPNLVNIHIRRCKGLQDLPWFSKLPHLKCLRLEWLCSVEYMENRTGSEEPATPFFPRLEKLELKFLKELKGWWGASVHNKVCFPHLSELTIKDCPNLKSVPGCPAVETVFLSNFSNQLRIMTQDEEEKVVGCYSGKRESDRSRSLRSVETDNGQCLKSLLPIRAFCNLKELKICGDVDTESLWQIGEEVMCSCASSLRSLHMDNMPNLRTLSGAGRGGGLEHLTALEPLTLQNLRNPSTDDHPDEEQGAPWIRLHGSLLHLKLLNLSKLMNNLPKGIQYLTSLRSLDIMFMDSLEALPEWIGGLSSLQILCIAHCKRIESLPSSMQQLTSLTHLEILQCSTLLHRKCQSPDGEDWPVIQHIPNININTSDDY